MKDKLIIQLYERVAELLNYPITSEFDQTTHQYKNEYLKLDYAPIYGGYQLRIVQKGTGENNVYNRSRLPKKEFLAYLQGLIDGITKDK